MVVGTPDNIILVLTSYIVSPPCGNREESYGFYRISLVEYSIFRSSMNHSGNSKKNQTSYLHLYSYNFYTHKELSYVVEKYRNRASSLSSAFSLIQNPDLTEYSKRKSMRNPRAYHFPCKMFFYTIIVHA